MKLAFIADEFKLRAPVQQLLDRFLMGYPDVAGFHRPFFELLLVTPHRNSDIERRIKDFGLDWQQDPVAADATLVFDGRNSFTPTLPCFAYGAPIRGFRGIAGTAIRGASLLPQITLSRDTALTKALIIVQGDYPMAEIEALDAIVPMVAPYGAGVRSVTYLADQDLWAVLRRDFWPLLISAISRSDSPQGDAVRDGRTQNLPRLGLLEKLAKAPRGWLIEHRDGLNYVIATMDGVVSDYNLALETRAGGILSAQIYRPPPPFEHGYNGLARLLEKYFWSMSIQPPWPHGQTVLIADLLERFAKLAPARQPDEKQVRA
jgi:hypothetical protein